jgi:acyl-CoA thioester hydrolase
VSGRVPTVPAGAYRASIGLRWGDMDSLGHINNVIFLRLLEEARVHFFTEVRPRGSYSVGFLAARHEIDYLRPLHYSAQPIEVSMWVERIGRASFTLGNLMADPDGQSVAAARTVIVAVDPADGTSAPIPDAMRGRLERFLAA